MSLAGVIFDFDGVIADTEPLHLRAYQDVLAQTPMVLSTGSYQEKYLGYDDVGVFTSLASDHKLSLTSDELDRLITTKGNRYTELLAKENVVFPEVESCLEKLAARLTLGIASGALHHEIEHILRNAGLRTHFSAIVGADDVNQSKPDPETYTRTIELLCSRLHRPVSASGFVAIEDSAWGISSARAAGLPCIAVTNTYKPNDLANATKIVSSLSDIDIPMLETLTINQ